MCVRHCGCFMPGWSTATSVAALVVHTMPKQLQADLAVAHTSDACTLCARPHSQVWVIPDAVLNDFCHLHHRFAGVHTV